MLGKWRLVHGYAQDYTSENLDSVENQYASQREAMEAFAGIKAVTARQGYDITYAYLYSPAEVKTDLLARQSQAGDYFTNWGIFDWLSLLNKLLAGVALISWIAFVYYSLWIGIRATELPLLIRAQAINYGVGVIGMFGPAAFWIARVAFVWQRKAWSGFTALLVWLVLPSVTIFEFTIINWLIWDPWLEEILQPYLHPILEQLARWIVFQ